MMLEIDEAQILQWTRTGVLVPASELAAAWSCTVRSLRTACARSELFVVDSFGEEWCVQWLTHESREEVAVLCRALGQVDPLVALKFWCTPQASLKGVVPGLTLRTAYFEAVVDLAREVGAQARATTRRH